MSTDPFDDAVKTSEFVESVVASTRSRLVLFRFPMIAFGLLAIGSALITLTIGPAMVGVFWLVAGIPASVATGLHYRRRSQEMGLVRSAKLHLVTVGLLTVGVFGLPVLVTGDPGWIISIWLGASYMAFARLEMSPLIAVVATIFIVMGLVFRTIDVANEMAWLNVLTGGILLAGAWLLTPRAPV